MSTQIRKWNENDIEGLCRLMNEADRSFLSNGLPYPYTEDNAKWWLNMISENDGINGIYRAIISGDEVIGMISLARKVDVYIKDGEVSYLLAKEYWGQGITTNALQEFCQMAFQELDILRITAAIFSPNIASQKVLLKCGFVLEGTIKNGVYKNDEVMDLQYYGKYRTE